MKNKSDYIIGMDIGTSKVLVLVAAEREEKQIELLGYGLANNDGMKKGNISNIDTVKSAIAAAVEMADTMSGVLAEKVYVSVGGGHIKGFNSRGSTVVPDGKGSIDREDIDATLAAARAVAIPPDREVIHLLPQEFIVDNDRRVEDPIGHAGRTLEAGVHLVTGSTAAVNNVVRCVQDKGISVADTVLSPFASSLSTVTDDEKELGVAVIDIGAGTSDLAVFIDEYLWHTAVLPLAGNNITSDIAVGLRTPIPEAEKVKKERGAAFVDYLEEPEVPIEVAGIGDSRSRIIDNNELVKYIHARCEEILILVKNELERMGVLNQLNAGIVLTGGTAELRGLKNLAEQVFQMQVRVANPTGFAGIIDAVSKPSYSTACGLIRYGYLNTREAPGGPIKEPGVFGKFFGAIRKMF